MPWLKKGSKTHWSLICLLWETASTASVDRNFCPCAVLTVPVLSNSHLQHQTVPLLQVHREQRRGQVCAEGPRTEEDPPGDRRYAVGVEYFTRTRKRRADTTTPIPVVCTVHWCILWLQRLDNVIDYADNVKSVDASRFCYCTLLNDKITLWPLHAHFYLLRVAVTLVYILQKQKKKEKIKNIMKLHNMLFRKS